MQLRSIKISKGIRLWLAILVVGLLAGLLGIWQEGWNIGDVFGFAGWLTVAALVLIAIPNENRVP